jgi:hypothetical protein
MATISVSLPSDGQTIDASDYNAPINTIVTEINGGLDNANIKSAAAISGSKIADASIDLGAKASTFDGWVGVSDAWSYASATTITVPSDATTKYSVGDKIKLVQSASTKYFYITAVAATLLTVTGGSDYTVANSAISGVYYSKESTPLGFPQWFAYTPSSVLGFSVNPTALYRFTISGRSVTVASSRTVNGTSNATNYDVALPITAKTLANMAWWGVGVSVADNGTTPTTPCRVNVVSAGTNAVLAKDVSGAAWTNVNAKGANWSITYEI